MVLGLLALVAGTGIYLFKTKKIEIYTSPPLIINKATFYTKNEGLIPSLHYYAQENLIPSTVTQPNQRYILQVHFPLFAVEDKVSWSQLEIGIGKEKTFTHQISQDEYTALTNNSHYTTNIFEIEPEHSTLSFIPGIIVFLLGAIIFALAPLSLWLKSKKQYSATKSGINIPVSNDIKKPEISQNIKTGPLDIANIPWDPEKYKTQGELISDNDVNITPLNAHDIQVSHPDYNGSNSKPKPNNDTKPLDIENIPWDPERYKPPDNPISDNKASDAEPKPNDDIKPLDIQGIPWDPQKYKISSPDPIPEQRARTLEMLRHEKVSQALQKALLTMDTTHKWYTDEDEANRELVSCLKAMGYNAVYHQFLGNGRTADAFFEESIIEAKLDPSQSEIDRLEGQVTEYLKFQFAVHVVLYGQVEPQLLLRIKEIISRRPDRTFLTYLPDATRLRKSNSTIE